MPLYKNYEVSEEDFATLILADEWLEFAQGFTRISRKMKEDVLGKYKTYVLVEYNYQGSAIIEEGSDFDALFNKAKDILISRYGEEGLFTNTQQLWHSKSPYFYASFVDFMVGSKEALTEGRT